MGEKIKKLAGEKPVLFMWCFGIAFIVSVGLFVAGFLVPPMGEISPSVLYAGGILMFSTDIFAIVCMLPTIIASGKSVSLKHGNMSVTIGDIEKEAEEMVQVQQYDSKEGE